MRNEYEVENITIDVHTTNQDPSLVRDEIRSALLATPRMLPTKYIYDDRGSELFEQICDLPEYYQTRTEFQLLQDCADDVVNITNAEELVELGAGAATKTRVLLNAMVRARQLRTYVPFDVSEGMVRRVAQELTNEYPGLQVHGVVGDFLAHLEHLPEGGRRLVAILGGTIGNLDDRTGPAFLSNVFKEMSSGDFFLLGVQLITDVDRLEAAYNDAAGVTAEFNKNILHVMRESFGATFDPEAFEHIARYNPQEHRMEMHLRSLKPQVVDIPQLDLRFKLKQGEEILTEISTKYDRDRTDQLLTSSGFETVEWFADADELHALALARKP